MIIDFEILRKELANCESQQKKAMKQMGSESKETQKEGKMLQASILNTLAAMYTKKAPEMRVQGDKLLVEVLSETLKK